MSNTDDYQAKIAEIEAIAAEEMKSPNMPVAAFIQEAEDLHKWCADDQEKLSGAGLDWTIVNDLPVRAGGRKTFQGSINLVLGELSKPQEIRRTVQLKEKQ